MASMRDIKRRKSSISSTQQITKAMKLVSTVKLQKAKSRAEETTPYFNHMYATVSSLLKRTGNIDHPYLNKRDEGKKQCKWMHQFPTALFKFFSSVQFLKSSLNLLHYCFCFMFWFF